MKCSKCGFVQAAEEEVCKLCGAVMRQPVLIKFPTSRPETVQALPPPQRTGETPEWRNQLKEKVQAIRARKGLEAGGETSVNSISEEVGKDLPESKPANPLVEAALSRVRRAGDTDPGSKGSTSLFASPIKSDRSGSYGATASAALPVEDPVIDAPPTPVIKPQPASDHTPIPGPVMRRVGTAVADPPAHEASAVGEAVSTASVQTQTKHEVVPEKRVLDLDWNEEDDNFDLDTTKDGYLDYSEYRASEDVNTATDSPLQVEFQFREASIRQRFVAGVVDVSLVLFACVPFAALIELNNVDLLDARVQMIMASVIALVHFLYTSLLLAIGGQTVGMMMTGIIAVDCENMDLPTFWGALRRSFGFVLSALPLFVGYFWPLIDRQHRSLSDIISGTSLKSAFEEYPSARVPWLYRPVG